MALFFLSYDLRGERDYQKLYDELTKENHLILNLASKEYSQCIKSYQKDNVTIIDVDFVCEHKGKLTTKATEAKMCRGSMVRFCAVHQIKDIKELFSFSECVTFAYIQ